MPRRKNTPTAIETAVLANSARRCALCFHLNGDLSEKHGQISHLDQDPSNTDEDNLAFLCLPHHSVYDSKTSQHKNYTMAEVKSARHKLYALVKDGSYLKADAALSIEADRKILNDLLELLPSTGAMEFLRTFDFGGSFRTSKLEQAHVFIESRGGPEHEFLNPALEANRQDFRKKLHAFLWTLAINTFTDYELQHVEKSLRHKDWEKYRSIVDKLNNEATEAFDAYESLVRIARRTLNV
ncbi:MAG: hypothetical protein IPP97_27235 [Candidatus Obscuribacter sp.]|nr:hypothetical protein [Candidatus Obscuribacter sp.]MBP6592805.1 hypothetical protein [Candidatus Obscuribacter sp.]